MHYLAARTGPDEVVAVSFGQSSSTMKSTAVARPSTAPPAGELNVRFTLRPAFGPPLSTSGIENVLVITPASNVSTPDVGA
jgi:hypothetical protein